MDGIYRHSFDAKGRIFIPFEIREELGATFHITRFPKENHLVAMSNAKWNRLVEQITTRSYGERTKMGSNTIAGYSATRELDTQGRIIVPKELRDIVGLDKRVAIVGNFDLVEFWDEDLWDGYNRSRLEDDEFAETFAGLVF
jgi:MraZ protein